MTMAPVSGSPRSPPMSPRRSAGSTAPGHFCGKARTTEMTSWRCGVPTRGAGASWPSPLRAFASADGGDATSPDSMLETTVNALEVSQCGGGPGVCGCRHRGPPQILGTVRGNKTSRRYVEGRWRQLGSGSRVHIRTAASVGSRRRFARVGSPDGMGEPAAVADHRDVDLARPASVA